MLSTLGTGRPLSGMSEQWGFWGARWALWGPRGYLQVYRSLPLRSRVSGRALGGARKLNMDGTDWISSLASGFRALKLSSFSAMFSMADTCSRREHRARQGKSSPRLSAPTGNPKCREHRLTSERNEGKKSQGRAAISKLMGHLGNNQPVFISSYFLAPASRKFQVLQSCSVALCQQGYASYLQKSLNIFLPNEQK